MPHAIRIHEYGGPEVMRWEEVPAEDPGPGEAQLAQTAIGLNYIETRQRSGVYKVPLPGSIGHGGLRSRGSGRRRRHRGQARRSRRLCDGRAGGLCRIPGHASGPPHPGPRLGHRRTSRRDDAERPNRLLPDDADLQGGKGANGVVPRRRRRGRLDHLPTAARAGRHRDRHRQHGRESGVGERVWLHTSHHLHTRGFRRTRPEDYPGRRRVRRVRRSRQDNLRSVHGIVGAVRHVSYPSARHPAQFRRSISACCRMADRSTPRARLSPPTPQNARICWHWPTLCSTRSNAASGSRSTNNSR